MWSVLLIWRVQRLYCGSFCNPCNIICSCNFILTLAWELIANVAGLTYDTVVKDHFAQFSDIPGDKAPPFESVACKLRCLGCDHGGRHEQRLSIVQTVSRGPESMQEIKGSSCTTCVKISRNLWRTTLNFSPY